MRNHDLDAYASTLIATINDELHIAIALNHEKEVRDLLQSDHTLVTAIDLHGNQPLHIAAQSGNIPIVKTLIEFDAPIGRRNYDGLTPVGVARFNGFKNVVRLIHEYYKVEEGYSGDEPEKYRYERIKLDEIPSQSLIRKRNKEQRMHQAHLEWIDWWKRKKEHDSASVIQRLGRYYLHKRFEERVRLQNHSALMIQGKWKDYVFRKQEKSCIIIQSFQRMIMVKSYFINFHHERLFWHRASRILSCMLQRLWRGYIGRSIARRMLEMKTLSDPMNALSFDEWLGHQTEAYPPRRTWNMYSEFVLGGLPTTWEERRLKRNGCYFRDVKFYANNLTQQVSWTQPLKWKALDLKEVEKRVQIARMGFSIDHHVTASKLQRLWRAKVAKKNLALLLKAHRVMKKAVDLYYQDPNDIVALCNYTLHVHVVQENMNLAMSLYEECVSRMNERANDNAFILYSYAIFQARLNLDYENSLTRAKACEIKYQKRHNQIRISRYVLANEIFRLAANEKQSGNAWHNYALCRMMAFNDFHGAKTAFLKAVRFSHHDTVLMNNFNTLLSTFEDEYDVGDAYDEFRKAQTTSE